MPDQLPTVASSANAFRSELEKYFPQPSAAREVFIYNSILRYVTKDQIQKNLKPIDVNGPNDVTYRIKVMPDYVMIGNQRVPMSADTARRVASNFGMQIPSTNLSKLIHQKADVQIAAKPLSGIGAKVDGKKYTGDQVVEKGVGYSPFAGSYNDLINQQLSDVGAQPGQIISGFAKDIVDLPEGKKHRMGQYGMYNENNIPIQGGVDGTGSTVHPAKIHSEYATFARFWDPQSVEIIDKNTGQPIQKADGEKLHQQLLTSRVNVPIKPMPKRQNTSTTPVAQNTSVTSPKPATAPKPTTVTTPKPPTDSTEGVVSSTNLGRSITQPTATPEEQSEESKKVDEFLAEFTASAHDRRVNIIKRSILIS